MNFCELLGHKYLIAYTNETKLNQLSKNMETGSVVNTVVITIIAVCERCGGTHEHTSHVIGTAK